MAINKIERRKRIHYRIRKVVNGTAQKPRMCVFRSNCQIYVQLIDDVNGVTLAAASSRDKAIAEQAAGKTKVEVAALVGKAAAERAALCAENSQDVYFTIGSSYIRKSEDAKIVTLAEWLKANPDFTVSLVGYADRETGTAKGNLELSKKRSAAVAARLVKLGVEESRIATDYKGDTVQPFQVNEKNRVVVCGIK